MRRSDFDYALPAELIAQEPLARRSASRLLLLDGAVGAPADHEIASLPELLRPGDLLVFNDTRVLPARLAARRSSGGRVEVFLERALGGHAALVQTRASNALREGERLDSDGGPLRLTARREDLWEVALPGPAVEFFERWGSVPLPPYIDRAPDARDRERYQSLFARVPGAVAAPTASLHFDAALLAALAARGVLRAELTLHVGAGTFHPVRSESLEEHRMHAEWYEVPAATASAIAAVRAAGGRVVAVGTTVARALEAAAAAGGSMGAGHGETRLFITPGYRFLAIDGLVTNFHLPKSTLLMLVAAFAGREAVLAAYRHAIAHRYRFFSYGDAMLVWPANGARA
ncbi:MAG: tRNA preQ1(34) S-adenosylmethionine ribosyltransferase-isomerase QueA [Gammaproteobacteria bacterium]|nr:tRNA preQ1(34) S-adenosylmethionine ribosyltransferase-isomerase QueA [Gammaproteobacteria bacterium]